MNYSKEIYDLVKDDFDFDIKLNKKQKELYFYRIMLKYLTQYRYIYKNVSLYRELFGIVFDSLNIKRNKLELIENFNYILDFYYFNLNNYFEIADNSLNNILINYNKLARELGIDKSLELCYLFPGLLFNGYFSVTGKHKYDINNRFINIPERSYFSVINGGGVCLEYSSILSKYLDTFNIENILTNCYEKERIKVILNNYRKSQISLKEFIKNEKLKRKNGNHAIVTIKDKNRLYAFDPTNIITYNCFNEKKNYDVYNFYKVYPKYIGAPLFFNYDRLNSSIYDDILSKKFGNDITWEEVIYTKEKVGEIFDGNKNLIKDAYDDVHSDMEIIVNETNSYVKRLKK